MTAIVGTLNRRGIAFAADSAATYSTSSTRKITNNTNKIFELSRKFPVGIAIYNNLDFYGIPWEVIIKNYRDTFLIDKSFPKLSDYADDFWQYLYDVILPKVSIKDQMGMLTYFISRLKDETISTSKNKLEANSIPLDSNTMFGEMVAFLSKLAKDYAAHSRTSQLKDYSKESFINYAEKLIDNVLSDILKDPVCPNEFKVLFIDALYEIITADTPVYLSQTGLVFWGYGEEELFPSYYQHEVSIAFDGIIKHWKLGYYEVSNDTNACVVPFAQTDVANTVVRGIDQKLRDTINANIGNAFVSFRNIIVNSLKEAKAPEVLLNALNELDILAQASLFIDDLNDYIKSNYTDKLLDTVAFLSKEDLADMAESLVRMTCLKRHITTDEESVGGPVDVAVITKGDGFVWIKRKHYFSSELNYHYFKRQ